MCGRYAASATTADLVEEFEVERDATGEVTRSLLAAPQHPAPGEPDYNVAPRKQARVVLSRRPADAAAADRAVRQLRLLTWGLVPSWAKSVGAGPQMINARAETLLTSSAFGRAAGRRRCLVPADGWFEWQVSPTAVEGKGRPRRQPFFLHRVDDEPLAFAAVYEFWRDPHVFDPADPTAWLTTFAIITTAAEPGLDRIHDRQPLVLDRADWGAWLDPDLVEPAAVGALLEPAPAGRFGAYPVGPSVGNATSNGPGLLEPLPPDLLHGAVDPVTGEVLG